MTYATNPEDVPPRRDPPLPPGWTRTPYVAATLRAEHRAPESSVFGRWLRGESLPSLEERIGAQRCAEIRGEVEARWGLR